MKKKDFCAPENISVMIPYKDFEKLVGFAAEYDGLVTKFDRMEKQLDALRGMYTEALNKIAEISRYL